MAKSAMPNSVGLSTPPKLGGDGQRFNKPGPGGRSHARDSKEGEYTVRPAPGGFQTTPRPSSELAPKSRPGKTQSARKGR